MSRSVNMYLRTVGLRGTLYAIKGKVTNTTVYLKFKRQDCRHPFWLRIPSTDVSSFEQVFINQEYDFFVKTKPEVIVDAGANIGLVSIYFANQYPETKIIALEPEQSNFQLLKKNVAPYPNIFPIQAALWNKNEEINVIDQGFGKWGFVTEMKDCARSSNGNVCQTTMAMTIDKIMNNYSLKQIDILKIDIEGAEREVFSDTSSWIKKIDSIIIELHERRKAGCIRSFYCGSNGFDNEWRQGEHIYLSRGNYLTRRST